SSSPRGPLPRDGTLARIPRYRHPGRRGRRLTAPAPPRTDRGRSSDRGAAALTPEQITAFAILGLTLVLLVWGRWRYDVVAVAALLAVVITGLVPADQAFAGFAHPAVVTVAAVLVISRGLENAGLVDAVVRFISPLRGRENLQ